MKNSTFVVRLDAEVYQGFEMAWSFGSLELLELDPIARVEGGEVGCELVLTVEVSVLELYKRQKRNRRKGKGKAVSEKQATFIGS